MVILMALSSCRPRSDYFGKTTPPNQQVLVVSNGSEPDSLDPHLATSAEAFAILDALFDGLVKYNPQTLEPMAAIATHYEVNAESTKYLFYLRGHPQPHGIRLPDTDTLHAQYLRGEVKEDFAHGKSAPSDTVPAHWSDEKLITANDFIYSWRRAVAPETAAPYANLLYYLKNAEKINQRKIHYLDPATGQFRIDPVTQTEVVSTLEESKADPSLVQLAKTSKIVEFKPEDLGVRALDDFTLEITLRSPTTYFLRLLCLDIYAVVARQAIESASHSGQESAWTRPEKIVSSGAFKLREWRPYDRIVVVKNQAYYEANLVSLERIEFLPVADPGTSINLYQVGLTNIVPSSQIPPAYISLLRQKRDFHESAAFEAFLPRFNTKRPPFDKVLVRYALNMSVNKKALADFLGGGERPAPNIVPPLVGYDAPTSLYVQIDGGSYDVLAFQPTLARELLSRAGYPGGVGPDGRKLSVEILTSANAKQKQIAEMIQNQWRTNLGIDVTIKTMEFKFFLREKNNLEFNGVAQVNWIGDYIDPNTFLEVFESNSASNGTGWRDPAYDLMLAAANSTTDSTARFKKLAECERYLLRAMPAFPLYFASNEFLAKPWVRGFGGTLNDSHPFKYVWIDTDWKSVQ